MSVNQMWRDTPFPYSIGSAASMTVVQISSVFSQRYIILEENKSHQGNVYLNPHNQYTRRESSGKQGDQWHRHMKN